jgi:hypothetical protein
MSELLTQDIVDTRGYPQTIVLDICEHAADYRAERYPTCGCRTCWDIWYLKARVTKTRFEKLLGTDFERYRAVIRHLAMQLRRL